MSRGTLLAYTVSLKNSKASFAPLRDHFQSAQTCLPAYCCEPSSPSYRFAVAELEMSDLVSWCTSGEQAAVRLLWGQAGAGKTRLAAQLCREMSQRGWTAGYLRDGSDPESVDRLRDIGNPLLLILDYGDAWEGIHDLLVRLEAPAETAPVTRLVLLARHSGEWWYRIQSAYPSLAMRSEEAVKEAVESADNLRECYLSALETFAQLLGTAGQASRKLPLQLARQADLAGTYGGTIGGRL